MGKLKNCGVKGELTITAKANEKNGTHQNYDMRIQIRENIRTPRRKSAIY